jgi:cation diffusion facilitator CzcD-associated flavoprotein CzcO
MSEVEVAIVGSGPYALSLAAHLRARDVSHRVFGPPMQFWREMPRGLNLKSVAWATSLHAPEAGHAFPEWCRARGLEDHEPCSMQAFAEYGLWFTERFVGRTEPVEVTRVVSAGRRRFEVTLSTGERVRARNIVSATGLSGLAEVPDVLAGLGDRVTHTSVLPTYDRYAGKEVAIVGAGASALEAAVFVHEAGGTPRLLVREDRVRFTTLGPRVRPLLDRIREPDATIGSGRVNWLLDTLPWGLHFVPERRRVRFIERTGPPSGPWWMRDRFDGNVDVQLRTQVVSATRRDGRAQLRLAVEGGPERVLEVDEVIAGTGFAPDVDRLAYLDADLRRRVRRIKRAPDLTLGFESSVPGLFFLGALSVLSFGPVFWFVAGTRFVAPTLSRLLERRARRRRLFRWR